MIWITEKNIIYIHSSGMKKIRHSGGTLHVPADETVENIKNMQERLNHIRTAHFNRRNCHIPFSRR